MNGYKLIAVVNFTLAIFGPTCYLASRIKRNDKLLIFYALFSTFINLILISGTQLDAAENLLWVPLFPLVFLFFSNLVVGLTISIAGLLIFIVQYYYWQVMGDSPRIEFSAFVQLITAYFAGIILGTIYEHSRRHKEAVLQNEANLDVLTNIANRRAFNRLLLQLIKKTEVENKPFSIVLFDVDDFKGNL